MHRFIQYRCVYSTGVQGGIQYRCAVVYTVQVCRGVFSTGVQILTKCRITDAYLLLFTNYNPQYQTLHKEGIINIIFRYFGVSNEIKRFLMKISD